jgi:hypothetical protein
MSKRVPLYKRYANKQACGVCYMGQFGGLELLDIDACEGDYGVAVACFNWGTGRQKIRRHKIQLSESGRAFIRKEGIRFYFDDNGRSNNVILRA